jgi:hypothetical protein
MTAVSLHTVVPTGMAPGGGRAPRKPLVDGPDVQVREDDRVAGPGERASAPTGVDDEPADLRFR